MIENYMDRFATPEQFIRAEVIANRGTQSIATKVGLLEEVILPPNEDAAAKTKAEIFDLMVEQIGDRAYTLFPVGVSSLSYQLKFGITHKDVLKMAKHGFIAVTGEQRFRMYGKYCYAKTYSPYDYFRLTPEEVHAWLAAHSKRRKQFRRNEDCNSDFVLEHKKVSACIQTQALLNLEYIAYSDKIC